MATCEDEKQARRLAETRSIEMREERLGPARGKASLEDLFEQMKEDAREDLKIVLKTDVQGTCEAVMDALAKLNGEKIQVEIILSGVGGITENDVLLASASNALVIGFQVRVNTGVNKLAKQEGVEIRLYSVIYELIEQIRDAMEGMLAPDVREETLGAAKILQIFKLDKKGKVCGCQVTEGIVKVGANARVYRDGDLIYNGSISSLRRFQDDVKEVRAGMECGIRLDNFNDFEEGDTIDIYYYKETKATLT
jgi:translation initiation factor IF-2